jgi:hypothetical protein
VTAQELKALYRRWLLELWHGDLAVAREIVAPTFVVHQARADAAPSEGVTGPDGLGELVRQGRAPFSALTFAIEVGPLVDGDLVAARWLGRGIYAGGVPGARAPPATPVAFAGIDILRAEGGRFAEYWVSSDGLGLMTQLGVRGGGG